ncbi:hypothetical protein RUM44_009857 [Polyplax serrata]|uniref:Fatty acyl-CoA reductase n=1 Tax=Polyplax serrata TaxID=468196 RepID=A0ABR1ATY4_POLSC
MDKNSTRYENSEIVNYLSPVFVHSSTAFCHVDHAVLEEKAYECEYKPKDFMNLIRWMDNQYLDKIALDMIKPHPNTYTFTKRLAEGLVIEEFPNMPVCIARPSIVCPAYEEPLPGWVDSLNGPVGILVAAGKGVLRSMYAKKEYTAEMVPVDFAINGLLAIAKTVATEKKPKEIPVFNITQAEERTATWGDILEMGRSFTFDVPFDVMLWFPDGNIRSSLWVHKIYAFFLHWLPAYFIDFLLFLFRQKRFMLRVQQKIEVGLEVLQYFTTHKWCFKNEKFLRIRDSMCPEDKKEFNMDFKVVEDLPYLRHCILGARQYLLKEPLENLPKARRTIKILYVIDRIVRFMFLLFFAQFLISNMSGFATYIFDAGGKNLKNVPFVRSFVPHEDMPIHRHM